MTKHLARLAVLVAIALALVFTTTPAQAMTVDEAKSAYKGGCLHKQDGQHPLTCIIGFKKITRSVYFENAPHWRDKNFYIMQVSVQSCWNGECKGGVAEGALIPRQGLPGKSADDSLTRDPDDDTATLTADDELVAERAMKQDVCVQNTTVCAAPWNWFGDSVTKVQHQIRDDYVYSCVQGTLFGYGGTAGVNMSTKMLLDTGLITKVAATKAFVGPAGTMIASLTGCTSGMALGATNEILDLWRSFR